MAGYSSMKMKRKDLEEVYDEFSDFSLSSPARKIRRLDAELPPIMEEEWETPDIPFQGFHQTPSGHDLGNSSSAEAVPSSVPPLNEERALVLYKPMNKPLVEITVNSDLIPGWRNNIDHVFWQGQTSKVRRVEEDEAEATDTSKNNTGGGGGVKNEYLAVVPWVPSSQFLPSDSGTTEISTMEVSEQMMEAEGGVESEMMEIEDDCNGKGESWQQWQQQHCMTSPQLPQNTSTPIMWSSW